MSPSAGLSVYISYAPQDHEWHNRIATHLASAGFSILDHPPTPREDLQASTREKAQVFVLLLSSHYLNSDKILKFELPQIRSLSQDRSRRPISVIVAPCEWQSHFGLHEFPVIPEDGRALAEGNEEQIKDNLHELTRKVRDAIREIDTEANSPQREQASTKIPPLQTLSAQESLALGLAAKVTIELPSGKYEAMATLVSPTLAVTTFQVISRSGFLRQRRPAITIQSLGIDWPPIQATLIAQDEAIDFAVLELASPVPFVPSNPFLPLPLLPALAEWHSYFAPAGNENGTFVNGSIELEKDDSSRLRLLLPQPVGPHLVPSINGAPVIVGIQLLGIVTDGPSLSTELGVVKIETMAKSKEGSAIRSLLHNAPAAVPDKLDVSFVEATKQSTAVSPDQPPERVIAGFQSDVAAGDDLLGITQEVESLCSVLAAKDVEPPVSIGLFGDWGSGKTFFMKQMEREFEFIERGAQTAKGETAYCSNIVQLWFNAWHYVDANLWASLVSHIFEGLADYVSPQTDDQQARARLLSELQTTKELRAEAEREKERALRQREETEKALTQLAEKRAQTEAKLTDLRLPDLQRLLETDTQLKKELEETLESLGFPAAMDSLASLDATLKDAHGLAGRLRTALLSLWQSKNRKSQIFLLVLVLVGFPVLAWLLRFWLPKQWLFTSVGTAWGELSVLAVSLTATLNKYVRKGSEYLTRLERARQNVATLLERKKQEKSEQELQLEKDLHEIKAKEAGTSKQFSDAQAKVREIEERVKEIDEGRSLSKFLLERVQADDYRKYLGIISSVRRDFEMLNRLWPRGSKGSSNQTLRPIDRIILYIDDLDRCPERTVVEVLQAIHLLLFFPLFVVVVGVDSRWLLHSLRQRSRVFQDTAGTKDDLSEIERSHWQTTPLNYLEKIFQIPYAIRPMQEDGFRQLMNNLTEHRDWSDQGQQDDLPTFHNSRSEPAQSVSVSDSLASSPEGGLAETGSSRVRASSPPGAPATIQRTVLMRRFDPNPKRLRLEERERQFILRLYGLIPSPRSAKRFLNVYRLLRSSIGEGELEEFLGDEKTGEYQAVQLLLAIQTGYPEQAMQIIHDLTKQAPHKVWWEFVQEYENRAVGTRGTAPGTGYEPGSNQAKSGVTQRIEAERWRELLDRLSVLRKDVLVRASCDDFVKWAFRVARYSFQSARWVPRS